MEKESNTFEKMKQEEGPTPEVEAVQTNSEPTEEVEVGMEIFEQGGYINTPDVGDTIVFTVDKIVKNPNISGTNKTTGEKFAIGVTKKDGTVQRYDIITTDGDRFTINSWSLFYMFLGKDSEFAKIAKELGSYQGIRVSLTRNYDGSVPNKKVTDIMKLYDFKTKEEAVEFQKKVAKAWKDGTLFTMTLE